MGLSERVVVACALGSLLVPSAARVTVRGDQGFPKPTVQEGPVEVRGTVNVGNAPTVEARQSGTWAVRVQGEPVVSVSTPRFLRVNGTYQFRWSNDRVETYLIVELPSTQSPSLDWPTPSGSGWVLAEPVGGDLKGRRYLNVAQALSIMFVR